MRLITVFGVPAIMRPLSKEFLKLVSMLRLISSISTFPCVVADDFRPGSRIGKRFRQTFGRFFRVVTRREHPFRAGKGTKPATEHEPSGEFLRFFFRFGNTDVLEVAESSPAQPDTLLAPRHQRRGSPFQPSRQFAFPARHTG